MAWPFPPDTPIVLIRKRITSFEVMSGDGIPSKFTLIFLSFDIFKH